MINIIRKENHNFKDCHNYRYDIFNESCHLYVYQKGSRDLAMCFCGANQNNLIKITKENYLLYKTIEKLYDNITGMKEYMKHIRNYAYASDMIEVYKNELAKLYDGKSIVWKSDTPIIDNTKLYNYLSIVKANDSYDLIFTSDINERDIVVEFNTDRSRYEIFVYEFYQLLYDLENITEPFRQIEMDEYLNNKKLVKK